MNKFRMSMGIPKPETAEAATDVETIDGMRRAILMAQRDDATICHCLTTADYRGLSGEDRYVFLAYQALRKVNDLYEAYMNLAAVTPAPSRIIFDRPAE